MEVVNVIKIHSSAFKQVGVVDLFINSIIGDINLFPYKSPVAMYQEMMDQMKESLTYCSPYAIAVGDMTPRRAEYKGKYMEFQPGPTGHPTLRDMDIMIYLQSWLANARIEGRKEDRSVSMTFDVEDFYAFSGRARRDDRDEAFVQALERLHSSSFTTNTQMRWERPSEGMAVHLVSEYTLERDDKGKLLTATVRVAKRMHRMIGEELFMLIPEDFVRQSPMRKALCLVLLSHCIWEEGEYVTIPFEKLHEISGSKRPFRKVSDLIDDIIENPLPGFVAEVEEEEKTITFWGEFETTPTCPREIDE